MPTPTNVIQRLYEGVIHAFTWVADLIRAVPAKTKWLYFVLFLPILAWFLIVLPSHFDTDLPKIITRVAVAISPTVTQDISVFGEVTPAILAGAVVALLPRGDHRNAIIAAALAFLTYGLFLHLSWYYTEDDGRILLASFGPVGGSEIDSATKIVLNLASNVRKMALMIFASIVGLTFRRD